MYTRSLSIACLLLGATSVMADIGFDLYFTSNLDEIDSAPLTFKNVLPDWLRGSLIRNGLGRFEINSRHVTTVLDAYAKLSKWTFDGGNQTRLARFSTQMVQSRSYTQSVDKGDMQPYMMLGRTSPPFNLVETLISLKNGPDNMNVNMFNYGTDVDEGYVIMSDFWQVYQIDPHDLSVVKFIHPSVPGESSYETMIELGCAHPLREYGTNNHITFVSLASAIPEIKSKFVIFRATSAETREQIAVIEVDMISYMHSFALTKKYMVIFATPLYVDPLGVIKALSPLKGFKWDGDKPTPLYVIDLATGFVEKFETENMFFLHQVNAFENEKSELVMDVVAYKDNTALDIMDIHTLHNATTRSTFVPPTMKRYTLNIEQKSVDVRVLDSPISLPLTGTLDFPTINEEYRFMDYCYVYGVVYCANSSDFLDMALAKKDICTGKEDRIWYKKGTYFNEAWFVPRPGATKEDDGVLLVDILDLSTAESSIVLFDAKTMNITNSALLPTSNPFGTHGRFFPNLV